MPIKTKLMNVSPYKLSETYDTLYELQQRLGIDEEYLLSTSRNLSDDKQHVEALNKLLNSSKVTRDNLITWYLKQTFVELNVTTSLLNAKIKFIEYKLGLCDGLDLHQSCSLSLVDFCNILADLKVTNVAAANKKINNNVSKELDIPIWLTHYRNQICHIPSESPCISILVPLVAKSLNYMKDHFWSKLIERDQFDARRCKKIVEIIASFTNLVSVDNRWVLRPEESMSRTRLRKGRRDLIRSQKACIALRKLFSQNPEQTLEVVIEFMTRHSPKTSNKNCSLLFEQIIMARHFELFVNKFLNLAKTQKANKRIISWIKYSAFLVFFRKPSKLKRILAKLNLEFSNKMRALTHVPDVKCCHIFLKLICIDDPFINKIVLSIRDRLYQILGRERTMLFVSLAKIATRPTDAVKTK